MSGDQKGSISFWTGLIRQFRLAWRLVWDPRVPVWTKLVPFTALLYIISPIDILPDWFLGFGQLDDLGVLLAGVRIFTALSPDDLVLQHLEAMGFPVNRWQAIEEEPPTLDGEIIEGEYTVRDE
jgi:uncharacterized membrane protein YkvA (DUF1232 family)